MSPRSAIGALAGGIGVVIGIVGSVAAAAVALVALGLPADGRAEEPLPAPVAQPRPTALVVAVRLGDPTFQAGVVRDGSVILARGLEIAIARQLARRLKIPAVRFVYVRQEARLLAATARPWHIALAAIRPSREASWGSNFVAYLSTDQAVVLRRGLAPPRSLRELRAKVTCALRGSDGARAIATSILPKARPLLVPSDERLLRLVQTGACDAALLPAAEVGGFVAGRGGVLGPVAGRVEHGSGYAVAVTRGGPIAVAAVERAFRRMRADGTMHRLMRAWLAIDPARLRVLR